LPVPVTAALKVIDCPVLISVTFVVIATEVTVAGDPGGFDEVPPPPQAVSASVANNAAE